MMQNITGTLCKTEFYLSNQIYPLDQLIVTFETKENPLTTEKIEKQFNYILDDAKLNGGLIRFFG